MALPTDERERAFAAFEIMTAYGIFATRCPACPYWHIAFVNDSVLLSDGSWGARLVEWIGSDDRVAEDPVTLILEAACAAGILKE